MEKIPTEELRFDYLCGKCFSHASRSGRPGKVLSCCDFLCYDCGNGIKEPFTCPSCRKQNVKFVATDDPSIPAEVARNISDPEQFVDQLKSVLLFQIKHYKTMLHRAVGKMMRDKKEFHRRLTVYEGGGGGGGGVQQGGGNDMQMQRQQIPPYQSRIVQSIENDSAERPRKMSRPATAGGAIDTASSSSSSGGVWRTGSSSIGSRIGNDTADSMDGRRQVMRRPMTGNGPPQGRGVESTGINGMRPNNAREGTSLISVLEGNDTGNRNIVGPQGNRYRDEQQQIQGRGQGPSPGQEQVQGQGYRPPFNTPSGVGTGQVQGRTPGFTPQTPNPPSSPLGIQRYANGSSSDRPLTPSTLFLPSSNSQQSQYFQRQQQQLQQQQQGRQQQQPYQQTRPGQGQSQIPSSQQGYPQRPSTTPTPLSRLRSPHSHVPVSLPRTPNTLASGTVAVTLSQSQHNS